VETSEMGETHYSICSGRSRIYKWGSGGYVERSPVSQTSKAQDMKGLELGEVLERGSGSSSAMSGVKP